MSTPAQRTGNKLMRNALPWFMSNAEGPGYRPLSSRRKQRRSPNDPESINYPDRLKGTGAANDGRAPITTEFAPNARDTLTTHIGESFLKVFDASALKETKTIQVGRSPVNSIFESSGRHAYVANRQSNTVSVVDTVRWEVGKTIKVGTKPFGIYLFDPSRGQMTGNR